MAAKDDPSVDAEDHGRKLSEAEIKDYGLGFGLDVTKPNPWEHRPYLKVRGNATPNDIFVMKAPFTETKYEKLVKNGSDLIFGLEADIRTLFTAVNVCLAVGFSRKVSYLQKVIGTRVQTRKVAFGVVPDDTTETLFEKQLCNSIKFDSIKEDMTVLMNQCEKFVKEHTITHYATAITLGAVRYQVVSSHEQRTMPSAQMTVGKARITAGEESYTFLEDVLLEEIGELGENNSVTTEGVIEIKIAPIYTVVKKKKLREALEYAVVTYCKEELQKPAGPFFIKCNSSQGEWFLKVNEDNRVEGIKDLSSATPFCIEQEDSHDANQFTLKSFATPVPSYVTVKRGWHCVPTVVFTVVNVTPRDITFSLLSQTRRQKVNVDHWMKGEVSCFIITDRWWRTDNLCIDLDSCALTTVPSGATYDENMPMLFGVKSAVYL